MAAAAASSTAGETPMSENIKAAVLGAKNEFDRLLDKIRQVIEEEVKSAEVFEDAVSSFSSACCAGSVSMGDDFKEALADIKAHTKAVLAINELFVRAKKMRASVVEKIVKGEIKPETYADGTRDPTPEELGRKIAKLRLKSMWKTLLEEVEKLPITVSMKDAASAAQFVHEKRKQFDEYCSDDEAELNRKRRHEGEDEDEEGEEEDEDDE